MKIKKNFIVKDFKYFSKLKYHYNILVLLKKKIIGNFFRKGNKLLAINSFFKLKYLLKKNFKKEPNYVLLAAIINNLVKLSFIKKRFGATKKELPIFLDIKRRVRHTTKFFLNYSISDRTNFIDINKFSELLNKSSEKRGLIRKNYLIYKKAIENKIFLKYRRK